MLLSGLDKLDQAIASYRKAIELNPGLVDAHYNLGICLQSQHDYTGAVECYRHAIAIAIAIEPGFFEAHGNLGTVLQEQGSLQDAVDCYRQALVIKPDAQLCYN